MLCRWMRYLEVRGTPVKVLDGVLMSTNIGTALFDISPKGDLAYAVGPAEDGHRTMHWVDRHGNKSAPLLLPARSYLNPRISPDGKYLAVEIEGPNHDLYTYDFQREVLSRISTDGISHGPIWSPDGSRIAYRTWKAGAMTLAWMPADRSGPAERLVDYVAWQNADSFSNDGQHLVFDQADRRTGIKSVWVLPIAGDRKPRQFAASGGSAKFSPDGKWVAYCSDESGQARSLRPVLARAGPEDPDFRRRGNGPGMEPRWQGALLPQWNQDDGGGRDNRAGVQRRQAADALEWRLHVRLELLLRHQRRDDHELRRVTRWAAVPDDQGQGLETVRDEGARRAELDGGAHEIVAEANDRR